MIYQYEIYSIILEVIYGGVRAGMQGKKAAEQPIQPDNPSLPPRQPQIADKDSASLAATTEVETTCCDRFSRWMQNQSYQLMAFTIWDNIISGFKPGRTRAIQLMDIKPTDKILLIGEGTGLDFECLPSNINKAAVKALDFSAEMVKQSRVKARQIGIPEENCLVADAQKLPFRDEKFDKIFFPLSLASIPNPNLALQEAERVLERGGKIVIFEKLVDDDTNVSWGRYFLNVVAKCTIADINRNLSKMMGEQSPLKIIHYESLENKQNGIVAKTLGAYYRVAVIVRTTDYVDQPEIRAKLHSM